MLKVKPQAGVRESHLTVLAEVREAREKVSHLRDRTDQRVAKQATTTVKMSKSDQVRNTTAHTHRPNSTKHDDGGDNSKRPEHDNDGGRDGRDPKSQKPRRSRRTAAESLVTPKIRTSTTSRERMSREVRGTPREVELV